MEPLPNFSYASSYAPYTQVRTELANDLHRLILDFCFNFNMPKDGDKAEAAKVSDIAIGRFLGQEPQEKTKKKPKKQWRTSRPVTSESAVDRPEIFREMSINGCTHLMDAVHLPFVGNTDDNHQYMLACAKAQVLFGRLTAFCKKEAERIAKHEPQETEPNDKPQLNWQSYADLLIQPTKDNYTLLHQGIINKNHELYKSIMGELSLVHKRGLLTDSQYAEQFTLQTTWRFTPLHSAIRSGNKQIYNHIFLELFNLHKKKTIDDATYAQQFIQENDHRNTPLCSAITSGNPVIFLSIADKLQQLHRQGILSDEIYEKQFTQATCEGFTPLQLAILSGNTDIFHRFTTRMQQALKKTSTCDTEYREKYQQQLEAVSDDNWNVFHCATDPRSANPFIVQRLTDMFHNCFGDGAEKHIKTLYKETTDTSPFRPAFHNRHPEWLEKLLESSNDNPIKPSCWDR